MHVARTHCCTGRNTDAANRVKNTFNENQTPIEINFVLDRVMKLASHLPNGTSPSGKALHPENLFACPDGIISIVQLPFLMIG